MSKEDDVMLAAADAPGWLSLRPMLTNTDLNLPDGDGYIRQSRKGDLIRVKGEGDVELIRKGYGGDEYTKDFLESTATENVTWARHREEFYAAEGMNWIQRQTTAVAPLHESDSWDVKEREVLKPKHDAILSKLNHEQIPVSAQTMRLLKSHGFELQTIEEAAKAKADKEASGESHTEPSTKEKPDLGKHTKRALSEASRPTPDLAV